MVKLIMTGRWKKRRKRKTYLSINSIGIVTRINFGFSKIEVFEGNNFILVHICNFQLKELKTLWEKEIAFVTFSPQRSQVIVVMYRVNQLPHNDAF